MFIKRPCWLPLLLLLPTLCFAQKDRKGVYGGLSVGYGSYVLDLYEYQNGGSFYIDQRFSGVALALGIEKRSAWQKDQFVFDVSGELTGGLAIKTSINETGNLNEETKGGYALGASGFLKAGYLFPKNEGAVTPLVGIGPYFTYIKSGGGDTDGNYIYGLQGFVGVDLRLSQFVLTPQIRFGLAGWGASDEMDQNGQPGMFEVGLKIAKKF